MENDAVWCADFTTPDGAACVANDDALCAEVQRDSCVRCSNATLTNVCFGARRGRRLG